MLSAGDSLLGSHQAERALPRGSGTGALPPSWPGTRPFRYTLAGRRWPAAPILGSDDQLLTVATSASALRLPATKPCWQPRLSALLSRLAASLLKPGCRRRRSCAVPPGAAADRRAACWRSARRSGARAGRWARRQRQGRRPTGAARTGLRRPRRQVPLSFCPLGQVNEECCEVRRSEGRESAGVEEGQTDGGASETDGSGGQQHSQSPGDGLGADAPAAASEDAGRAAAVERRRRHTRHNNRSS